MRSLVLAGAALAGAAGCTTLGHERVAGWPKLAIYERYVPHAEMQRRCARYAVGFGASPLACAEFNFSRGRCDIWYSRELGVRLELVAHERPHWKRRPRFSARLIPE